MKSHFFYAELILSETKKTYILENWVTIIQNSRVFIKCILAKNQSIYLLFIDTKTFLKTCMCLVWNGWRIWTWILPSLGLNWRMINLSFIHWFEYCVKLSHIGVQTFSTKFCVFLAKIQIYNKKNYYDIHAKLHLFLSSKIWFIFKRFFYLKLLIYLILLEILFFFLF